MSWLEWIAAILGVINVGLIIQRSLWNYPFGLLMVLLYGIVFYQSKLYSEMLLQIFFFVVQIYGWIHWADNQADHGQIRVERLKPLQTLAIVLATAILAAALGLAMDYWTDANAPYIDAVISAMSVTAQLLLARRYFENWTLWIVVDILAVWLYYQRELYPTMILYAIFLVLASIGWYQWHRILKKNAITIQS